jgi:FkbM family methyltransferase
MDRYGHTQNGEERYIVGNLGQSGRFLDIGAFDGKTFSSTYALAEKGWTGVYVEPDPHIIPLLRENTREFRSEIVECAIGPTAGILPFYATNGDMVGTLSKDHVKKWQNHVDFHEILVPVMTLPELAQKIGMEFDFINLDVEGLNWQIFRQFDWKVWKASVVCIEYDDMRDEIKAILEHNGFRVAYMSAENIVAVRQ